MSFESSSRRKDAEEENQSPRGESRFAALTAGLLARKGEAEPALEPFTQARVAPGAAREMAPGARHMVEKLAAGEARRAHVDPIDDTNEVREEWQRVRPADPAPMAPPSEKPDDAPRMAARAAPGGEEFAENCPRQKIAASPKRAAVTFRMSVHDFLRLKLASAELERSSQDIIVDALEDYLDANGVERLDNCRCLAEAARACGDREAAE